MPCIEGFCSPSETDYRSASPPWVGAAAQSRRGASSYQVGVAAGLVSYDDVTEAYEAWQGPWDPAQANPAPAIALARRTGHPHRERVGQPATRPQPQLDHAGLRTLTVQSCADPPRPRSRTVLGRRRS